MKRESVLARMNYDPATGHFNCIKAAGRRSAGQRMGYTKGDGYRLIAIAGKYHYAHRLAWLVTHGEWPPHEIDHINGDRDDNRIENLRAATRTQNMMNSATGKGWHKHGNRWQALIRANGKRLFLGCFDTEAQAREAYEKAAREHHGAFSVIARPEPAKQEVML
jgi:hypothetical protein